MKMRLQILPHGLRLLLVTVGLGIGTGLVGIACHYLLEGVQWVAFGEHRLDLLQQFEQAGGVWRHVFGMSYRDAIKFCQFESKLSWLEM